MTVMIRWTLNSLIGEVEDKTQRKLSLRKLAQETGISYPAIHRISQNAADRIDTQTLDKLLKFFRGELKREVTAADLLRYEDD